MWEATAWLPNLLYRSRFSPVPLAFHERDPMGFQPVNGDPLRLPQPEINPPAPSSTPQLHSLPGPTTLPQIPQQPRKHKGALDCLFLRSIGGVGK